MSTTSDIIYTIFTLDAQENDKIMIFVQITNSYGKSEMKLKTLAVKYYDVELTHTFTLFFNIINLLWSIKKWFTRFYNCIAVLFHFVYLH